jgi:hypothetical protein
MARLLTRMKLQEFLVKHFSADGNRTKVDTPRIVIQTAEQRDIDLSPHSQTWEKPGRTIDR